MSAAGRSELRGRRVLVTGASGFIGGALCARLLAAGATVHGVSRQVCPADVSRVEADPSRAKAGASRAEAGLRWHRAELAEADDVRRLLDASDPEVVFHCASQVTGSRDLGAVLPTFAANLAGTVNLLTAATERGVTRLVLAGSMEEPDPGQPPASPYAAAKSAATGYARMFHRLYGTPVVTARIFMVYGPGQRDHTKLVPYLTSCLVRGEQPRLGSGSRQVDWIFIDDLLDGLLALGTAPGLEGLTLDLGSGRRDRIAELVRELYALLAPGAHPPFGTLPDRPFEVEPVADIATTAAATGWMPRTGLRDGLAATVAWFSAEAEREHADRENADRENADRENATG